MKTNPFPVTAYLGPEYFCNRSKESEMILSNIKNGLSTTVVALRRMGKTGLIKHVFHKLPRSYIPVYIDILATQNQADLLNAISTAIVNSVPEQSGTGKRIWDFIRSLRPIVSYDPVSGIPQISIESNYPAADTNIRSVLMFLEKLGKKIVIAIDEFQQILDYPENNTDAWLRSVIQSLTNVTFIFSGSQRHLMTELFANPKRPFYRSTQLVSFDTIEEKEYFKFITYHYVSNNKKIDEQIVHQILKWTRSHTFYVQLICNRIFSASRTKVTNDTFYQETIKLLKEQELIFYQYRELLTKPQWNLLTAIGLEEVVDSPTSIKFISKYKLGNPATVLRSLRTLEHKEMIYSRITEEGKKRYYVYDLILNRWLQGKYNRF